MKPSAERIHQAYDSAVSYFGATDSGGGHYDHVTGILIIIWLFSLDFWMDYIKHVSDPSLGQPEKVGQIYFRAKRQLDEKNIERFIAQYSLFQAGHAES
jgi:hypothetical protein